MASPDSGTDCFVCTGKCNLNSRKAVLCAKCNTPVCRECIAHYVNDSMQPMQCMCCKNPWSRQFLSKNMTSKFMSTTFKEHQERIVFDRERSLLPATLPYVVSHTRKIEVNQLILDNRRTLAAIRTRKNQLFMALNEKIKDLAYRKGGVHYNGKRHSENRKAWTEEYHQECSKSLREQSALCRTYSSLYIEKFRHIRFLQRLVAQDPTGSTGTVFYDDEGKAHIKHREFITRGHCPKDGCNSFIGAGWKCCVCDTHVCKTCMEVIPSKKKDEEGETHVCKPETIATVALIREDCKPCPSCHVRIYRVHGCAQMWCTKCNTAFDWASGEARDVEFFHNPHHAEWLVKVSQEQRAKGLPVRAPLNPCDLTSRRNVARLRPALNQKVFQCGAHAQKDLCPGTDMLPLDVLYRTIDGLNILAEDMQLQEGKPKYEVAALIHLRNTRVSFLLGEMTEKQFKERVQRTEKRLDKSKERASVMQTYSAVCHDTIVEVCTGGAMISSAADMIMNKLQPFIRENLQEVEEWFGGKCKTPFVFPGFKVYP